MMLTRMVRMRQSFRDRFSEWMLAAIMLGTGWMFSLPPDSLGTPTLTSLSFTMPEGMWAMVCTLLGGARIVVLALNGAWRRQGHARAVLGAGHLMVWTQLSISFINYEIPTPGDVIFVVFVASEIFLMFRASAEAGATDMSIRNGGN